MVGVAEKNDVLIDVEKRFVDIKILGKISRIETIATGKGIRELERLHRVYGIGRWRKRKGIVKVRLPDGALCEAEVHWYEAHGIGRKEFKIKKVLGESS